MYRNSHARGFLIKVSICLGAIIGCSGVSAAQRAPRTNGQVIYETCVPCHGAQAQGRENVEAPPLAGLPAWYVVTQLEKFADGGRGAHPDHPAGLRMRPIGRSLEGDTERQAVAQWVANLPPAPHTPTENGDEALGAQLFTACAACHGNGREGIQSMGAPGLVGMAPWAINSALDAFARGHRGGAQDDPRAQGMRAMSATVSTQLNRQAVNAYLASMQKQPKE